MIPGTENQGIVIIRVVLFDGFISLQRTVKILSIKPSALSAPSAVNILKLEIRNL